MANKTPGVPVRSWLAAPLTPDVKRAIDRIARAEDVQRVAIMPDVHLASEVCIGTVIATTRVIYPHAIGSDIGCGMAAIAFGCEGAALDNAQAAPVVLAALRDHVPILRHRSLENSGAMPASLGGLSLSALRTVAEREGRIELGTLGRGNHFLEFQRDQEDRLWLMVRSGSRVMGQEITRAHAANAERAGGGLVSLDTSGIAGQAYLNDVQWAVRYAAANRAAMIHSAAIALKSVLNVEPDPDSFIDASHNHVRWERYPEGVRLVHRKGASPAEVGEAGLIPGSMGTASFHVVGRGVEEALRSSSHGAGRAMSRGKAGGRISTRQLEDELGSVWLDRKRLHALSDEAPSAYKDIRAVMRAQRDLVRITRELTPVLSYKGA